jgi:ferrochelatase
MAPSTATATATATVSLLAPWLRHRPPQTAAWATTTHFTVRYAGFKFRNPPPSMADSTPRFGFVAFAETWNGRLAMLGFVIGLATELLTGQGILSQIGLG